MSVGHTVNENAIEDDALSDNGSQCSDKDDYEPLCTIQEDPHRNFPTFSFSKKMKKKLYRAWNQAVIVKVLGKTIGYKLLLSILQPLWAKMGFINLINIDNGFFVVKFTNKDDYRNALTGGPWMIFDHYLTIRPWEPLFHPLRAAIDRDVWKVAQKPKRAKKTVKEKPNTELRQADDGSRFGVLAAEG
ncbi:hypothetical protein K1719_039474 [Acacia pycnantha]|nr:hypothetical protein K1719_039474 [Acacia pycnantha]